MTRTNVVLDENLVEKAKSMTGLDTVRSVVDYALKELVRHGRQKDLLKLKGTIHWEGSLTDMRKKRKWD